MGKHHNRFSSESTRNKLNLNKRLEDSGWGFFLLMIGTLLLLPSDFVPQGAWLIGAGMIMLGLNAIRYLNNIAVSRFTVVLGGAAVMVGLASFVGLKPPFLAIFLALVGLSIIVKTLVPAKDRRNRHQLTHG